jgi:hypothetical protein
MDLENDPKVICSALDQFCVPAAVIDFGNDRFLTYNQTFREAADPAGEFLSTARPKALLTLSDPAVPLATPPSTGSAQLQVCTLQTAPGEKPRTGQCFLRKDSLLLLVLDTPEEEGGQKEYVTGKLLGRQMERARVKQIFHDTVSPEILAAAFAAETLTARLDATGSDHTARQSIVSQAERPDHEFAGRHQ